jgi:cation diffusion facilitator CzcD-associated flavoprotein CzcO
VAVPVEREAREPEPVRCDPFVTVMQRSQRFDAVIVGAGFAGLYMLHRLRSLGFSARVCEAGSGVGGTWFWNRYPGARCDVESMEYSYQFSDDLQQQWNWTERYAAQPEILRYANHVADRFELRRDIRFNTRVEAAAFDEAAASWRIRTGDGAELDARYCIMATGCLSCANLPAFRGLDTFAGRWYHTGHWPHEGVDFTGLRVGVVGTGSSAIQSIPIIAEQAKHLTVFQRSPNYAVPARNAPLDPEVRQAIKADYAGLRQRAKQMRNGIQYPVNEAKALEVAEAERRREYEFRWERGGLSFLGSFSDLLVDKQANDTAAEFVREKIRKTVHDPAAAATLAPRTIFGCKRLCIDSGYYQTFNRANVTLIDVNRAPIAGIVPKGLVAGGKTYELDAIVFATGFDAMTGALRNIDIRGRGGKRLAEKWADGPRSYLGLAIADFPNLFTITGPGSPSVLTNMLPSIEQHVEWIADCMLRARERDHSRVEPTPAAEQAWMAHVAEVANATLFPLTNSWYVGANIAGKPRVFMPYVGGFPRYVETCNQIAADGYAGFALS